MSIHQEPSKPPSENSILIGFACLIGVFVLFYFQLAFWGWALLGIAVYGFMEPMVRKTRYASRSTDVAVAGCIFAWVAGLVWALWGRNIPPQVAGLAVFIALVLCFVLVYALIYQVTQGRQARILISSGLCLLAGGLFAFYQLLAHTIPILDIATLFLAADTLRRGVHNLLANLLDTWPGTWSLFLLPEALTILVLLLLSQFAELEPYFHMTLVILAIALFKYASERTLPELDAGERAKIGDTESVKPATRFYTSLQGLHSSINLLLLGLVALLTYFGLPQRLISSSLQGTVFQAGLALLGIVVAIALLILGQRRSKSTLTPRQQYILQGLLGIIFIFIVISAVAFIGMAITSADIANLALPNLRQDSLTKILMNKDATFGLLVLALYEWIFIAVPLSLAYIYAVIQDFLSRY